MQDHQHRRAAIGKLAHRLQGGVLMQRVEHGGRLIEQQGLPLLARPELCQYPRQVHPLTFATGQGQVAAASQMPGIGSL
ncbi:hypothetical protein D3C85_1824620 [compost metagenome]